MSLEFAEELLPISGLQHLSFCERRCALVHLERIWADNFLTAEGNVLHERVHSDESETRGDLRTVRGLPLVSRRLGLSGVADLVEFRRDENSTLRLPKQSGTWSVFPVEYKRGKQKDWSFYEIQLCAQAICLEEMLGVVIGEGSLYSGKTKSRRKVVFDEKLRAKTEELAEKFHSLMQSGITPPAVASPRCENCSLIDECLPTLKRKAADYIAKMIEENLK